MGKIPVYIRALVFVGKQMIIYYIVCICMFCRWSWEIVDVCNNTVVVFGTYFLLDINLGITSFLILHKHKQIIRGNVGLRIGIVSNDSYLTNRHNTTLLCESGVRLACLSLC